jgi:hypothetical protein
MGRNAAKSSRLGASVAFYSLGQNAQSCQSERGVATVVPEMAVLRFPSRRSGGESHLQDELSPRNKVEESLLGLFGRE